MKSSSKQALVATLVILIGMCVMFSSLFSNEKNPKHRTHAPHYFQTVEVGHWPYPTR